MTNAAADIGSDPRASRVNLSRMVARRRRVWLQIVAFLGISALLVLAVMLRRDQQALERCRRNVEQIAAALERSLEARQPLPIAPLDGREAEHYHYDVMNGVILNLGGEVGLACCAVPHRLFLLRDNGRHVVIGRGGHVEVRWVDELEFQRRSDEWHLHPRRR